MTWTVSGYYSAMPLLAATFTSGELVIGALILILILVVAFRGLWR